MTLGTPLSSQLLDPSLAPQYPQGKLPTWPPRRVRAPRPQLCQFAVPLFAQLHWPFDFLKLAIRFPASGFLHMPSPLQHPFTHSAWLTPIHLSDLGTNVTSSAKPSFPALRPEIRLLEDLIGRCSFPSCHWAVGGGVSLVIEPLFVWLVSPVCGHEPHGG